MKIIKYFPILSFFPLTVIFLLYGGSPQWFASTFLGEIELNLKFAYILRAIMCLYLALGLFWLFAAFNDKYRNTAVFSIVFFADGWPSSLLNYYTVLELVLTPVFVWEYKHPASME